MVQLQSAAPVGWCIKINRQHYKVRPHYYNDVKNVPLLNYYSHRQTIAGM